MGNFLCTPHNAPCLQFATGLEQSPSDLWLYVTKLEEPGLYQVSGLASNTYVRPQSPQGFATLARYLHARTLDFPSASIVLHTNFGIREPLSKDPDTAVPQITQLLEFMSMIDPDGE